MLRFVTCFLLVDIFVSGQSKGINPRSVNLALETVLAFDHKDKKNNIKFIDDIQTFLSKVRKAVDPKIPSKRNFDSFNNIEDNPTGRRSFNDVDNKEPSRRHFNNVDNKIPGRRSFNDVENKPPGRRSFNDKEKRPTGRRSFNDVDDKTPARRNSNVGDNAANIKFIDFVKELLHTLKDYEDDDLQDIFNVFDDELKKHHYKGCKFYELVQNGRIRKFFMENLKQVKRKSGTEIRAKLHNLQRVLEDANFNEKQTEVLDYINSLYTKNDGEKFNSILNNIMTYKNKYKRANIDLVQLVRKGIRSTIFDHYSKLNANTRRDFKIKIETYWLPKDKTEKKDHRIWNIHYRNTDSPTKNKDFPTKSISHYEYDPYKTDEKSTNEEENMDLNEEKNSPINVYENLQISESNIAIVDEVDRRDQSAKGPKKPVKTESEGFIGKKESLMDKESEEKSTDSTDETNEMSINENELFIDVTNKNKHQTKSNPNLFINLQSSEYVTPVNSWDVYDGESKKKRKNVKKQMSSFITLYPDEITLPTSAKKRFKIEYTTMKTTESMLTLWPEKMATKRNRPIEDLNLLTKEINAEIDVSVTNRPRLRKTKTKKLKNQSIQKKRYKHKKHYSDSSSNNEKSYEDINMKAGQYDGSRDTETKVDSSYENVELKLVLTPPKKSRHYRKAHKNKRAEIIKMKKLESINYLTPFNVTNIGEIHLKERKKTTNMYTTKPVKVSTQREHGISFESSEATKERYKKPRNKKTKEKLSKESAENEFTNYVKQETLEENLDQKSFKANLETTTHDKLVEDKAFLQSIEELQEKEKKEHDITVKEFDTKKNKKLNENYVQKSIGETSEIITPEDEFLKRFTDEEELETTIRPSTAEEKTSHKSRDELVTNMPDITEEDLSQELLKARRRGVITKTIKRKLTEKNISVGKKNKSRKKKKATKNNEDLPSEDFSAVPINRKPKLYTKDIQENSDRTRNINMRVKKNKSDHDDNSRQGMSQSYETVEAKRLLGRNKGLRRKSKEITSETVTPNLTVEDESLKKFTDEEEFRTTIRSSTAEKEISHKSRDELVTYMPGITEEDLSRESLKVRRKGVITKTHTTLTVDTIKRKLTEKYITEEKESVSRKKKKATKNNEDLASEDFSAVQNSEKQKLPTNDIEEKSDRTTRNINMRVKENKADHGDSSWEGMSSYEAKAIRNNNVQRRNGKPDDAVIDQTEEDKNAKLKEGLKNILKKNKSLLDYWEGTTRLNLNSATSAPTAVVENTMTEQNTITTIEVSTSMPKTTTKNFSNVISEVSNKIENTQAAIEANPTEDLTESTISNTILQSELRNEVEQADPDGIPHENMYMQHIEPWYMQSHQFKPPNTSMGNNQFPFMMPNTSMGNNQFPFMMPNTSMGNNQFPFMLPNTSMGNNQFPFMMPNNQFPFMMPNTSMGNNQFPFMLPNTSMGNNQFPFMLPNTSMGNNQFPFMLPNDLRSSYHPKENDHGLEDDDMKQLFAKYAITPSEHDYTNHSEYGSAINELSASLGGPMTPEEKEKDKKIQATIESDLAKILGDDLHMHGRENNITGPGRRSLVFDGLNDLGPEFDIT